VARLLIIGGSDAGISAGLRAREVDASLEITLHPVTVARLDDLRRFSESHGKFRYSSCMRWRLTSGEFQRSTKDERIGRLEALSGDAIPIGVLGYVDGVPISWCSVAPRESYRAVERSRAIPRIDNRKVWAVVCFFLDSRVRGKGLRLLLLHAAIEYARHEGAEVVEGYPVEPGGPSYGYMGRPELYEEAGFREVARAAPPGATPRRIMRIELGAS